MRRFFLIIFERGIVPERWCMFKLLDNLHIKEIHWNLCLHDAGDHVIAVVIDTSEKADDFVRSGLSRLAVGHELLYRVYSLYHVDDLSADGVYCRHLFQFEDGGPVRVYCDPGGRGAVQPDAETLPDRGDFLSVIFWLASQYWVPRANEIRTNFQTVYVDRNSSYNGDPYKKPTTFICGWTPYVCRDFRYYDTASKTASSFFSAEAEWQYGLLYGDGRSRSGGIRVRRTGS
jgi:hypothetical protein